MTIIGFIILVLVSSLFLYSLYDVNNKSKRTILTHAKSFDLDPRFELIGGVDVNNQIRNNFEKMKVTT